MNVVDNRSKGLEVGDILRYKTELGNTYSFLVVLDTEGMYNTLWLEENEIDFETGFYTVQEIYNYYMNELTEINETIQIIKAKDVELVIK